MISAHPVFWEEVDLKYQIYNALFLTLPFENVRAKGILLPVFAERARRLLAEGVDPRRIVSAFFEDQGGGGDQEEQYATLFTFLQIVERQVVLFDALEDAAFGKVNDLEGPGTLNETLSRIQQAGKTTDLARVANDFRVRIVLTAHPTQFYPSSILGIITDLAEALERNDLPGIYDLLLQLGKTRFRNPAKPTPREEAESLLWYLENVFYGSFSDTHGQLACAARASRREALRLPAMVELGFWPGGDRDGNPYVTAETTREVSLMLRSAVLSRYISDVEELARRLTFDGAMERVRAIRARLVATLTEQPGRTTPYRFARELLDDLLALWDLLHREHAGLFVSRLEGLIWRVQVFGFHFATLDVRQDSRVHGRALQYVLGPEYGTLGTRQRFQRLEQFLGGETLPPREELRAALAEEPVLLDTVDSLAVAREIQQSGGERAVHRYIISNTQSAANVLEVLVLARIAGFNADGVSLDIVPLFETVDDLQHASDAMRSLYESPVYRAHLTGRSNRQTIMLGFSDGTKDGGYVTANWLIYRAKEELSALAAGYGVQVVFFEGRGGPPARGGGKTHQFYRSVSRKAARDQIHLTIQGQTISSNFGTETAAQYNLEQLVTAGLENLLLADDVRDLTRDEENLIEELSETSLARYRALKEHPRFLEFLERMTPLRFYGEANIASRPTSRGKDARLSLETLRAIPFVGSWSQMKQNVPGYFGFGSALASMLQSGRRGRLRQIYRDNLFFRTLVENSMQSLSKVNVDATRYLAADPLYGDFWQTIAEEARLTRDTLLEVAGADRLLPNDDALRASIALRESIVEPVLVIQQYALQRLREEEPDETTTEVLRNLVIKSMAAIVNAGRNSV